MKFRMFSPILFSAVLLAQTTTTPAPNPNRFSDIQVYLGLTNDQVTQLQQLRRSQVQSVQPIMQQLQAKQQSLRQLLSTPGASAAAVGQIVLDMQALRQQLSQGRQTVNQQALNVLNADQKTKLQTLANAQKLLPDIMQATALGLLAPADAGMGFGFGRGFGPAGPGMGGMRGGGGMGGMMRRPMNP